jgi:hypothetical protein
MAVSKSTRRYPSDTRRHIQTLFRKSHVSGERRRAWYSATAHLDGGVVGLRFPIYEHLYQLNLYAQKLFDLVGEISERLNVPLDDARYHQYLIQQVRSAVTSDVLDQMGDIEHIEGWLFESLRRARKERSVLRTTSISWSGSRRPNERGTAIHRAYGSSTTRPAKRVPLRDVRKQLRRFEPGKPVRLRRIVMGKRHTANTNDLCRVITANPL